MQVEMNQHTLGNLGYIVDVPQNTCDIFYRNFDTPPYIAAKNDRNPLKFRV